MKIAILVTQFPPRWNDGTQIATYNIAKNLAKRNHDIHILTRYEVDLNKYEIIDGFTIHRIKLPKIRFFGILLYFLSLLKILKKINPEIVHAQMLSENGWFAVLIKIIQKRPYTVYLRGSDIYESPKIYIKIVGKFVFKKANSVIALTNDMKTEIQKVYNRDVEVIPNGINPLKYKDLNKSNCRLDLGFDENEKILLFTGRLVKKKCVDDLILSMEEVVENIKNIKLLIIGEGSEKEKLNKLVENKKLNKNIIFIGRVPNDILPKYIFASDIFILVSYAEGYPMVFTEVFPSGLPIITSDYGGNPEIIKNKENGLVVELHNVNQISNAIITLLTDKQLRDKISINNIKKIDENSWENIAKQLENVYENILKNIGD